MILEMEAWRNLHATLALRLELLVIEVVADELFTCFVLKLHLDILAANLGKAIGVR